MSKPLRLLVLSDTHCNSLEELPGRLLREMEGADMILHAGDYTGLPLASALAQRPNFRGVYGNLDGPEVRALVKPSLLLELQGYRIGLCHPYEGGPPQEAVQRALRALGKKPDLLIHGHTHVPVFERRQGLWVLNPGSATGAWPATKRTYALLSLGNELSCELVEL